MWKGPIRRSLQQSWHCYGAHMAFYIAFLQSSCWGFSAAHWHFQDVHYVRAVHGALKTQWYIKERITISLQTPWTTTGFAQWPLCTSVELLLRCRRPYCVSMRTLRWHHCTLIRTQSQGICFEHAQRAHHRSAFYAIPQHLLGKPLHCCGDACYCTAGTSVFCIFLGGHGITVRKLLWCDRVLVSIYHITLQLLWYLNFGMKTVWFCHINATLLWASFYSVTKIC